MEREEQPEQAEPEQPNAEQPEPEQAEPEQRDAAPIEVTLLPMSLRGNRSVEVHMSARGSIDAASRLQSSTCAGVRIDGTLCSLVNATVSPSSVV